MNVEEHVTLARYTTIGNGGPARWFAKPETLDELQELLRWARDEGHGVEAIGLGSNVLVHAAGVDGLVVRLAGPLGQGEGGGAALGGVDEGGGYPSRRERCPAVAV